MKYLRTFRSYIVASYTETKKVVQSLQRADRLHAKAHNFICLPPPSIYNQSEEMGKNADSLFLGPCNMSNGECVENTHISMCHTQTSNILLLLKCFSCMLLHNYDPGVKKGPKGFSLKSSARNQPRKAYMAVPFWFLAVEYNLNWTDFWSRLACFWKALNRFIWEAVVRRMLSSYSCKFLETSRRRAELGGEYYRKEK